MEDMGMTDEQFWNSPLDEEEQWYEDHFDEFKPVENQPEIRKQMMEAAKNPPVVHHASDKKPVTMRLDTGDIISLKDIAREKGLPYQSLIGSILHQYASGTLVELSEVHKIMKAEPILVEK